MNETLCKAEKANAISHGVGAVLSAAAFCLLVLHGLKAGSLPQLIGGAAFGAALVIQYLCSTLLHCSKKESRIRLFEQLDHAAIYVLIAGTYTPFLLIGLNGRLRAILLSVVWSLALCGVFMKLVYTERFMRLSIAQYFAMGWRLSRLSGLFGMSCRSMASTGCCMG